MVKWYFHLPIWVVLGIAIQQFIQLLRRLQWESEPEVNDDDLRQELREVKNALRELRLASDEKRGSRVDKPDPQPPTLIRFSRTLCFSEKGRRNSEREAMQTMWGRRSSDLGLPCQT